MFHLFTHAFFKALLFLGAGSVIHAMHHEQDMRYYGGLRKQIPITFWAMLAGTLAITGVGVLGFFGFAGFYSKDAILEAAFARGTEVSNFAFWAGAFAALRRHELLADAEEGMAEVLSKVQLASGASRAGPRASISSTPCTTGTTIPSMAIRQCRKIPVTMWPTTFLRPTMLTAPRAITRMKVRGRCWSRWSC